MVSLPWNRMTSSRFMCVSSTQQQRCLVEDTRIIAYRWCVFEYYVMEMFQQRTWKQVLGSWAFLTSSVDFNMWGRICWTNSQFMNKCYLLSFLCDKWVHSWHHLLHYCTDDKWLLLHGAILGWKHVLSSWLRLKLIALDAPQTTIYWLMKSSEHNWREGVGATGSPIRWSSSFGGTTSW